MAEVDVMQHDVTTRGAGAALAAVLLSGAVVAAAATVLAGGEEVPVPGLPDAGPVTALALPLARLAHDVLAAGTVGALLLEGVLLARRGQAPPERVGRVAVWALAWATATATWAVLSLSDALAVPVLEIPSRGSVTSLVLTSQFTLAQVSTTWLAVLVALGAAGRPSVPLTRALLAVALVALVPTAYVGHAGTHDNLVLGLTAMSLHLVAASVWVGGLLALVVHLRGRPGLLAAALPRFSAIALVCVVLLTASGVVGAVTVLDGWGQLVSSGYGLLLLAKVLLLGVLVLAGAAHRRRTVGAAVAGRPGVLLRLAVGELVVMGAVMGMAVTLSSVGP